LEPIIIKMFSNSSFLLFILVYEASRVNWMLNELLFQFSLHLSLRGKYEALFGDLPDKMQVFHEYFYEVNLDYEMFEENEGKP